MRSVGKPDDCFGGTRQAESYTRPFWEKQGGLIVPIDFLTKYCLPRRQAGFLVAFVRLPHLVEAVFE